MESFLDLSNQKKTPPRQTQEKNRINKIFLHFMQSSRAPFFTYTGYMVKQYATRYSKLCKKCSHVKRGKKISDNEKCKIQLNSECMIFILHKNNTQHPTTILKHSPLFHLNM